MNETLNNNIVNLIFLRPPLLNLVSEIDLHSSDYDGILWISTPDQKINNRELHTAVDELRRLDKAAESEIHVFPIKNLPAERLVYSPTGKLDPDYDDARIFRETADKGVRRLLKTGVKRPLVVLPSHEEHTKAELVALLGVLNTLYVVSRPIYLHNVLTSFFRKLNYYHIYYAKLNCSEI